MNGTQKEYRKSLMLSVYRFLILLSIVTLPKNKFVQIFIFEEKSRNNAVLDDCIIFPVYKSLNFDVIAIFCK